MTRSRLFKLALPAVVALGAGTAVAIAAIPASDGTSTACYATTAASPTLPGQLRDRRRGRRTARPPSRR